MLANFFALPLKQMVQRLALLAVALFALVFVGDLLWFQLRVSFPKLGVATGSVHRFRILAIPNKGGRVDYEPDTLTPEDDVRCAHALFSHAGMNPCSYVSRHANDPIPM